MTYKMAAGEDFKIVTKSGGEIQMPAEANRPLFSNTSAYSVGAEVYEGSVRYRCISAVEAPSSGVNPLPSADTSHWKNAPSVLVLSDDLDPLLFAQYYPDGSVKSAAEFTQEIKYDAPDTVNRTITVKPFSVPEIGEITNSELVGRVIIPPFVDAYGNGYISDDGTRFKVVGVSDGVAFIGYNTGLTAIIAPNTVTDLGVYAFAGCTSLASVSLPSATDILFFTFFGCTSLASVDFGTTLSSVPSLDAAVFTDVPNTCKIIVPDSLYDDWITEMNWEILYADGYQFLRHSEWEYARKYEVPQASTADPIIAGIASTGSLSSFSRGDHVHPAETEVVAYALPDDCFPITYTYSGTNYTVSGNDGLIFVENVDIVAAKVPAGGLLMDIGFDKATLRYQGAIEYLVGLKFNGVSPEPNTFPVLHTNVPYVRDVQVAKPSDIPVTSVNNKTGAVVLSASDVGALGNSGAQTLNGTLEVKGTRIEEYKIVYDVGAAGESNLMFPAGKNDYLALLSDIYAAVQQIAPDFTAKAYAANELCAYNGVVYRCKSEYTATASSAKPYSDTTHWEAKKVSELFLPLAGGAMTGPIAFAGDLYDTQSPPRRSLMYANDGWKFVDHMDAIIRTQPYASGFIALLSDVMRFSRIISYAVGDVVFYNGAFYRCTTAHTAGVWNASHFAEVIGGLSTGTPTAPTPTSGDDSAKIATTAFVQDALSGITPGPDNTKLDSDAAAPDYDSTKTYQQNDYVTHLGKLYFATQAITAAEDWTDAHWQETDMTSPDATLDITSQGALRVVAADGTTLWHQGYQLASGPLTATGGIIAPSNEAVNVYSFSKNATSQVVFRLPTAPNGKVGDFIVDVVNPLLDQTDVDTYPPAFSASNTYAVGAAVVYDSEIWRCVTAVESPTSWTGTANWEEAWPYFSVEGLSTTVNMVVPEGENLSEILSFAPGTMCELYFTQVAFNKLSVHEPPMWKVVRQDVEVVAS